MAELHVEKHSFGAEVDNILCSMRAISCDTKGIFLWELIFNAAEALYDFRMASVFDKNALGSKPGFFIHIVPDKANNTLSIIDSGIGMTKDDLVLKLGSISSKDRQEKYMTSIEKFRKAVADDIPCVDVNREFCLGFYSVFLVADKVVVTTKHNDDEQYVWETSQAPAGACGGFFTITRATSCDSPLGRGTKVTLSLKEDQFVYLEERTLKELVGKYSEFCAYPMSVLVGGNNAGIEKQIVVDEIEEGRRLKKKEQFEGLRKRFEDVLGNKVDKVIVSDRVFELCCWMSADFILEINPEYPTMEELRKKFESHLDDENVSHFILLLYELWYGNIRMHDAKYGTSFHAARSEAHGLN